MSRNTRPRVSLSRSILAGAILMFSAPLCAQAASYTYINQKAPYQNTSPPMLTALNLPKVGTTFKVLIPNATVYYDWFNRYPPQADDYYLVLGVRNPDIRMPGLGGFLFTSPDIVLVRWNPQQFGGTVAVSLPIPNSPQLVGIGFYQQVLMIRSVFDQWKNAWVTVELRLSRGGHAVIGK